MVRCWITNVHPIRCFNLVWQNIQHIYLVWLTWEWTAHTHTTTHTHTYLNNCNVSVRRAWVCRIVQYGLYIRMETQVKRLFWSTHLVTDGAVVVGVHHGHLHDRVANEESVARGDVDQVEVVLLPVQWPLHIQLPFALNQPQGKRATVVPTWRPEGVDRFNKGAAEK